MREKDGWMNRGHKTKEREVLSSSGRKKVAGRFGRKIKSVLSRERDREGERGKNRAEASRAGGIAGIMESSTCGPISRVRDVVWCGAVRYGTLMVVVGGE